MHTTTSRNGLLLSLLMVVFLVASAVGRPAQPDLMPPPPPVATSSPSRPELVSAEVPGYLVEILKRTAEVELPHNFDATAVLADDFYLTKPSRPVLVSVGARDVLPNSDQEGGTDIFLVEDGKAQRISDGLEALSASLSPSGMQIALVLRSGELVIHDRTVGSSRTVLRGTSRGLWIDEQTLAVQYDPKSNPENHDAWDVVGRLDLATLKVQPLTSGPDSLQTLSPNRDEILYARVSPNFHIASLFTVPVLGGPEIQRTNIGVAEVRGEGFVQTPVTSVWLFDDVVIARLDDGPSPGSEYAFDLSQGAQVSWTPGRWPALDRLFGYSLDSPVSVELPSRSEPPSLAVSCTSAITARFRQPITSGEMRYGFDHDTRVGYWMSNTCCRNPTTATTCKLYDDHKGLDFVDSRGKAVRAMRNGFVYWREDGWPDSNTSCGAAQKVGWGWLGNQVRMRHSLTRSIVGCSQESGGMWRTYLGHGMNGSVLVQCDNQMVYCSAIVMSVASSGCSYGPHVHAGFEKADTSRFNPYCGDCSQAECYWTSNCTPTITCP